MLVALTIASFVLYLTFLVWAPAAGVLYVCRKLRMPSSDRAHFYWRVLKWPALVGIVSLWAVSVSTTNAIISPDLFFCSLFLAYWVCFRNAGRDDEEKKDRKRVRARLKQVGGRLVVVGETTPV